MAVGSNVIIKMTAMPESRSFNTHNIFCL